MESTQESEIAQDFSPFLRIYKDGRVDRIIGAEIVPPSLDPKTNVQSKDVVYSPEINQSVRIYIPKQQNPEKLPLLVYFHGGGFVVETAFSPAYHNYLNLLVGKANVVAVSVDYRRAPEHPVPIPFDDSWTALKWVASHANGNGPEEWLNDFADFGKVFFAGDSAGATLAHQMGIRHGGEKLDGVNVNGIVLIHPYFGGIDPIGSEAENLQGKAMADGVWHFASPKTSGCDDPLFNPVLDPKFASLGCTRVLVCVAEKDYLVDRGRYYYEKLKESGWRGEVEFVETKGEEHVFHLQKPDCEGAVSMLSSIVSFINQDVVVS
ncbi:exostosin family protein [Tripterygium wilfordii]|uniref:Exostosin family protein n=1 Tax=Tripterygium wilfordii TaxID=458696 RepID=A0A7J7DYR0_TRIWF|nr:probable carboxylesterase 12 [Tripterygium wilfordii]KAF5751216.1 exostosin family protein [Tripterygium wilfordii]